MSGQPSRLQVTARKTSSTTLAWKRFLAQPSGLALDGNNLFFADSETSAIRVAKIGPGGRVVTLTGTGLFAFGDRDGIGKEAVLQHPQDVASAPGAVYIADTYNHKIKRMDLSTLRVTTIAGDGTQGSERRCSACGQFR